MKVWKYAMVTLAVAVPFSANADCSATGCYNVLLDQIQMTSTGNVWIQTSGTETLADCTPDSGIFLQVPVSNTHMKEIYSMLLAAQLADKFVNIIVNQGTSPCTVSYVTLSRQ
jgi:hypothetical protein